jgi:hypothetical protein
LSFEKLLFEVPREEGRHFSGTGQFKKSFYASAENHISFSRHKNQAEDWMKPFWRKQIP